jgi:hypothetical protein
MGNTGNSYSFGVMLWELFVQDNRHAVELLRGLRQCVAFFDW